MIGSASAIDRFYHYLLVRQMGGVSPAGLWLSFLDWAVHLSLAPGTQAKLAWRAMSDAAAFQQYLTSALENGGKAYCVDPAPQDKRFSHPQWRHWPFNALQQSFLLCEGWWDEATSNIRGVSAHHAAPVNFAARQLLDMVSPSNFLATNPEVLEKTYEEGGANLVRGFLNLVEDSQRAVAGLPPVGVDAFKVGKNIAVTPGKVIARTRLMELIQYEPSTKTVHPDPVLIVPAWIMKYYILDLSPSNSLVKYLVDQGFTVFMISWKNPDESYSDCGMDDYRRLGVMEALRAISQVSPERKVNALGYCLGGTLLTIAAAAMARDGDNRIKTLTLLAAQTDFSDPGELNLFVGDSTLAFLEDMMAEVGYLDGAQMAGTFQLLRSTDLIYSRILRDYLMGGRQNISDMMAWNADATRMPARMHSEYLRKIFFENTLAEGRYIVDGRAVALRDISAPMFVVGTESDHVAPWRSVYQINVLSDTDVTFLLTTGGHNAGIVSEPGRKNRSYRVATAKHDDPYIDPDTWLLRNKPVQGSWWPEWVKWLRSGANEYISPPPVGAPRAGYIPICDAPGAYVFE